MLFRSNRVNSSAFADAMDLESRENEQRASNIMNTATAPRKKGKPNRIPLLIPTFDPNNETIISRMFVRVGNAA